MAEIWLAFMAGLSGSGHCLGMCGGIVTAMALAAPAASPRRRLCCNLAYHAGRIATYALLGLLAGAASQAALFSSPHPLLPWLLAAANGMVIVIGLATAFGVRGLSLTALDGLGWGFMGRALGRAARQASPAGFLCAGLMMGVIPCGLVYGVLIAAAGGGSWLKGGGMMLAFGTGTLPVMLACGQAATALSAVANRYLLRIMGLAVAGLGMAGLWRLAAGIGHLHGMHP